MTANIMQFEAARNYVFEKERELKDAECSFRVAEIILFNEITNGLYKENQIISVGTDFEYRIMKCYVHKMYLGLDNSPSYKGIVKAIRVKKGTNDVIQGKYDSLAYANEIYTDRIKNVLRQY
jgi:hypothetical protein